MRKAGSQRYKRKKRRQKGPRTAREYPESGNDRRDKQRKKER